MARIIAKRLNAFEASPDEPTEIGDSTRRELTEAIEQLALVEAENARLVEQIKVASSQEGYDLESMLNSQQMAEQTITTLESEVERLKTLIAEQDTVSEAEQVEYLASQLQVVLQELAESRARISAMEHLQDRPTGQVAPDLKVITSLSQDLRKPMSALLSYTELLQNESPNNLNQTQLEYLSQVHQNTSALASLLNNLIHVTAIETGTLELHPIPVDLQTCIEEAVSQTSTALRKKDLALQIDLRDDLPAVLGDEDALLQVFVHLLNNAIGASPEGERIMLNSHTASSESGQYLTVTITDQGGGIPPEDLGKVFDPVYKTRGLTIIGIGESGIGLSIVRSLMEAMGGRVWVDSQLGSGSSFTVLIPLSG
jgi:signal transduction histidine kinase